MRFKNFLEFFEHLGNCPQNMSLDRINNDGHYEKGNVRWASKDLQMSNRSDNVVLCHNGESRTLSQWSKHIGVPNTTLWARVSKYGWAIEKALTTPVLTNTEISKLGAKAKWGKRTG